MRNNRTTTLFSALALALLGCHAEPALPADPILAARQRLIRTPRDPAVHLELANLAYGNQDYLRAMQYLSLVDRGQLSVEQRDEAFRLALAITVRARNYDEAIRRTQEELLAHESLELRRLLALFYEAHGNLGDAERQHLIIAELYPGAIEPLAEAARFYERSNLPNRISRARELYERYLQAAPNGPESAQVRAALVINRQLEQRNP